MIVYKVHLMLADDSLRSLNSNSLGIPIDGKIEILTFINGVAETQNEKIAQFIKECFVSRMFVKEEKFEEVIPLEEPILPPKEEVVSKSQEKRVEIMKNDYDKPKEENVTISKKKKRTLRPAVVKSADTLKTPKRKRSKK